MPPRKRNAAGSKTSRRSTNTDYAWLAAAEALAAIQAFIASAVAHGDMAAIRACGRILLKMSNGVAQCFDGALGSGVGVTIVVRVLRFQLKHFGVFSDGQL